MRIWKSGCGGQVYYQVSDNAVAQNEMRSFRCRCSRHSPELVHNIFAYVEVTCGFRSWYLSLWMHHLGSCWLLMLFEGDLLLLLLWHFQDFFCVSFTFVIVTEKLRIGLWQIELKKTCPDLFFLTYLIPFSWITIQIQGRTQFSFNIWYLSSPRTD